MLLKIEFLVVTECSVGDEIEHLYVVIGSMMQNVDTFYGAIHQFLRSEFPQMIFLFKTVHTVEDIDLENKTEKGIKLH